MEKKGRKVLFIYYSLGGGGVEAVPKPELGMFSTAVSKFLKGKAIMSSFGAQPTAFLECPAIKLISGLPFAKVFVMAEHALLTG
jgi:hypothetical protein